MILKYQAYLTLVKTLTAEARKHPNAPPEILLGGLAGVGEKAPPSAVN